MTTPEIFRWVKVSWSRWELFNISFIIHAFKHRIIYSFWFTSLTGYLKCHVGICIHFLSSSLFESTGLWRAGWPCTYHIQQETLLSTLNSKIYNISSCKIRTLGCHGIRRFLCSISADQKYGWIINSSKQGTKKGQTN